jgi:pimeloyl-ACP methyl ester carboxylesterase
MNVKGIGMNTRESSAIKSTQWEEWNQRSTLSRRTLLRRAGLAGAAAMALGAGLNAGSGLAPRSALAAGWDDSETKPTIMLVHGAWADGSSWDEITALLLQAGYPVTAAAIPLSALAADVARVQSVLALQSGPTVLVGHSIGGAVISGAGFGQSNVKALVYISAFAPDQGETIGQLAGGKGFAPEPGTAPSSLYLDSQGYAYLRQDAYLKYFAPDVSLPIAQIKAAAQRPVTLSYLSNVAGPAAWRALPSWFLVSTNDQMINPDLQRFEAQRMGSTVLEVASSHASPLSHPLQVFQLITQAVRVAAAG